MADRNTYSGIDMGNVAGGGNFSAKNVIEDFMKTDYQEGLRNEFNMMDALINKLPKDTISGKVKYKAFALGITDNVRAVGSGTYDRYELGFDEFYGKGVETVEAQFDTTKLMATFAITDEAILKGTGDGSLIDVLKDSLSRMEIGLKHTYNRYIYGGASGIIGEVDKVVDSVTADGSTTDYLLKQFSLSAVTDAGAKDVARENRGVYHNKFYGSAPKMIKLKMTNSHSLIEGMGAMIECLTFTSSAKTTLASTSNAQKRYVGRIWQKDNTDIHGETVIFIVEKEVSGTKAATGALDVTWGTPAAPANEIDFAKADTKSVKVYSRQLSDAGKVAAEYHGLEDIVCTKNNFIFGVDRSVYTSLNCTSRDLEGNQYLNEELLRDLSDHLALTSPEGTAISLVCANHRIISQVEKSLYQFKNINLTSVGQGMQLGCGSELRFDNYVLYKDKYARDNNVYMLDQAKIGELVRRDFTWITSGEVNGVLQRRPGTEMYEGIMNKYADMYIDAWRCHAVIKHCKVNAVGTYLSYDQYGAPKFNG